MKNKKYKNVHESKHPLVKEKLTCLRDFNTKSKREYRALMAETARLLGYEVTQDLPLRSERIKTPLEEMDAPVLAGKNPAIVYILRAALAFEPGLSSILPNAVECHIDMARDHDTHEPVVTMMKMDTTLDDRTVIVVDPMLATGGSASAALDIVKKEGAKDIRFLSLLAAPEGIKRLQKDHPDVKIYTGAIDRCLDENAYIRPGLGDAGDRAFGTASHDHPKYP